MIGDVTDDITGLWQDVTGEVEGADLDVNAPLLIGGLFVLGLAVFLASRRDVQTYQRKRSRKASRSRAAARRAEERSLRDEF
jgi:hypothetical protein